GWPRVKASFFDPEVARASLPAVLDGLWLNVRVMAVSAVVILVVALLLALARTLPGPVFFPVRALATAYVDVFRGLPLILVL
ncbi:ABC transporter permease, partial [Bacillus thuringiensis]